MRGSQESGYEICVSRLNRAGADAVWVPVRCITRTALEYALVNLQLPWHITRAMRTEQRRHHGQQRIELVLEIQGTRARAAISHALGTQHAIYS